MTMSSTRMICWAAILFLGNGLVATPNAVTVIADLAGAISIATAMFLILELSHPYTGLIRISPAGVDNALRVLGKVSGPVSDEIGRAQDVRTAA